MKISKKNLEVIQRLTLMDDSYMTCFFHDYPQGAELVLRMILEKPKLEVESVRVQATLTNIASKSCRMDVLAKDQEGNRFDIEIQVVVQGDLLKRGRFYLSSLDLDMIDSGEDYNGLKEAFVIFICTGDVLGQGLPMYELTMKERTCRDVDFGHHLIFINANYPDEWRLKKLMDDFKAADPDQMYYQELRKRATELKKKEAGSMYVNEALEKWKNEAINEAIEAKLTVFKRENDLKTARKMLEQKLSVDIVHNVTELPVDEIEKLESEIQQARAIEER